MPGGCSLFAAEELRQPRIREVGFVHERACAGVSNLLAGGDLSVDRGEYDPRVPRQRREFTREGDPISIGQLDVDEHRRCLRASRGRERRRDAVSLSDHREAAGGE